MIRRHKGYAGSLTQETLIFSVTIKSEKLNGLGAELMDRGNSQKF